MEERREQVSKLRKLLETAQELEMDEEEIERLQNKLDKAINDAKKDPPPATSSRALRSFSSAPTSG